MPWWSWVLIGSIVWVTAVVVAYRAWAFKRVLRLQQQAAEAFERDFPAPSWAPKRPQMRRQRDPFDRP